MSNNRRNFIKITGMAGAASLIPFNKVSSKINDATSCILIPTETAGPFPLDLTANTLYLRQDIRENKTGVQLNLKIKIIGDNNCEPMSNLRVNIWHCDKDGLYSGYSQTNNQGQAGLTYLRGYQITDANGEVEFTTIFPGWYSGRICHIHFQVYVSSSYAAISQMTFPVATKNEIYASNNSIYTKGADPMSLASDNIFSDGYAYQMATLTPNTNTGGYDAYIEATIKGTGTVGIGNLEKENSKQFVLGQNFPNPYLEETTIPISLKQSSDVMLEIWDLTGKKVATIQKKKMNSGDNEILVNLKSLGLTIGNYIYQIEVSNSNGVFKDCKMMTSGQK